MYYRFSAHRFEFIEKRRLDPPPHKFAHEFPQDLPRRTIDFFAHASKLVAECNLYPKSKLCVLSHMQCLDIAITT